MMGKGQPGKGWGESIPGGGAASKDPEQRSLGFEGSLKGCVCGWRGGRGE